MPFYLKSKKLDLATGDHHLVAVMHREEAERYGIQPNDRVQLNWGKKHVKVVDVDFTTSEVAPGELGLYGELWRGTTAWLKNNQPVELSILSRPASIEAIKKKILGKNLTYAETKAIISDIVDGKLSDVELTYYVASGFLHAYTLDEMYHLVKAMAETGEEMNLNVKVVDKHSIGGIPNNRTTMLVIPIIASLGLYIPKTSSRAITSPAGTADTMEVLAPVSHSLEKIKQIVKQTHGCLVWGGGLALAPADDRIIQVSRPLAVESYDKMIVSIMAKKVAMGVDFLVIDIPYGPTAKVKSLAVGKELSKKFIWISKKFGITTKVVMTRAIQPVGRGVGPALEARDVLRVLQQHELRPHDLEVKAINLAGQLLELKKFCKPGQGKVLAKKQLISGAAWEKMNQIIVAQGGKANIKADSVVLGAKNYEIHALKAGKVVSIDNKAINEICMNLGAPNEKIAGIHFHVDVGNKVAKGDKLFTLYARNQDRINLALKALENHPITVVR